MESAQPMPDVPRFLADTMLGRLARWLRVLGYDTAYDRVSPDDKVMVEQAIREHRRLLTRDRYLVQRRSLRERATLVTSDELGEQLLQLNRELPLDLTPDVRSARCVWCNLVLEPIPPETAAPLVPAFVAGRHDRFARCPGCEKIYWPGTHWTNLLTRLARLRERADRSEGAA